MHDHKRYRESEPDPGAVCFHEHTRTPDQANVRIIVPALLCVLIGLVFAVVWYYRASPSVGSPTMEGHEDGRGAPSLSDVTRRVLSGLDSPVEIRFYSSLGRSRVPPSLSAFSGRVDDLLSAFSQEARGAILVTRHDPASGSAARAQALSDGIQPWTMDQGSASYLGLAVIHENNKVAIPRLSEEWEGALEYDLTRAITRVTTTQSQQEPLVDTSNLNTEAAEQIARSIPDLATVSAEEGTRILNEAALAEFQSAVADMQLKVQEAEQRFLEAQRTQSEDEQRLAMEQLQRIRKEHTQKLQELARQFDEQLAALNQLKGVTNAPPTR